MPSVTFTPLPQADFDAYLSEAKAEYAKSLTENGLEPGAARERACQEFDALVPQGTLSPNNYVMAVRDAKTMACVGQVWILDMTVGDTRVAYICDIRVLVEHQGQGYGTAALQLLDDFVRQLGINRLQVHVVGKNLRAAEFYGRGGFVTTDIMMQRDVPARAPAAAEDPAPAL